MVSIWWRCFLVLSLLFYLVEGGGEEKCPPGKVVINKDCSICYCTAEGKQVCSTMLCYVVKLIPEKDKISGKFLGIGAIAALAARGLISGVVGWAVKKGLDKAG